MNGGWSSPPQNDGQTWALILDWRNGAHPKIMTTHHEQEIGF